MHSDADHHRSVFTLAGGTDEIVSALVAGARACAEHLDLRTERGGHPHVGALDVAPVVFLDEARRGAACAAALVAGEELGRAGLPVFLYGLLAGGRTRAQLRRGGPAGLAERIAAGELTPDFGPRRLDPRSGAVLVGARAPLIAFNVELTAPATLDDARRIAALIRETGDDGLPGVRALGLRLDARDGVAQVSTNVEDHRATPLAAARRGGRAPRPVSAVRARRAGAGGGVRRLPGGRPGPPPAHRRRGPRGTPLSGPRAAHGHPLSSYAPWRTKKKRRSKHRGNAAGMIESRGRTGRTPSAASASSPTRSWPPRSAAIG